MPIVSVHVFRIEDRLVTLDTGPQPVTYWQINIQRTPHTRRAVVYERVSNILVDLLAKAIYYRVDICR